MPARDQKNLCFVTLHTYCIPAQAGNGWAATRRGWVPCYRVDCSAENFCGIWVYYRIHPYWQGRLIADRLTGKEQRQCPSFPPAPQVPANHCHEMQMDS